MAEGREPGRESVITVAAIQTRAHTGAKEANNQAALEALHRAADAGARLMVLPELGNSGYVFDSREEALELAEPAFGGPTSTLWAEFARDRDAYACGGLTEIEDGKLLHSAVRVG